MQPPAFITDLLELILLQSGLASTASRTGTSVIVINNVTLTVANVVGTASDLQTVDLLAIQLLYVRGTDSGLRLRHQFSHDNVNWFDAAATTALTLNAAPAVEVLATDGILVETVSTSNSLSIPVPILARFYRPVVNTLVPAGNAGTVTVTAMTRRSL